MSNTKVNPAAQLHPITNVKCRLKQKPSYVESFKNSVYVLENDNLLQMRKQKSKKVFLKKVLSDKLLSFDTYVSHYWYNMYLCCFVCCRN